MSGLTIEKYWNLGDYSYPFYRFVIENYLHLELRNKKGCLMFDAGCGSKICSISKIPKNVTVIGLDIDRKSIHSSHKAAKEKRYGNFHYIIGSLLHLPIVSGIFDICVCVDVIEHLLDKNNAIARYRGCANLKRDLLVQLQTY
jgi:2-polyprenyl-3-methyl-5-hydroxy-6-metoxy-1,4-benzoquinol methylase